LQIYKTRQEALPGESDYINELVDNDLSLEHKIDLLISSYQKLKLDPTGFRNLIEMLGDRLSIKARFPRKGDVNERFDVLFTTEAGYKIVAEIEIPSTAILDAPRNLLDDIAIMTNRHENDIKELESLVICWDLPNNRTDYWNVVQDINNILKIKIKTCTVLALAILVWTGESFDIKSDKYYLSTSKNTLEDTVKILAKNGIDASKYSGLLYPIK